MRLLFFLLLPLNIYCQDVFNRRTPDFFTSDDSLFIKKSLDSLEINLSSLEFIPPFDLLFEDLNQHYFRREIKIYEETEAYHGAVVESLENDEKTVLNEYYTYFIEEDEISRILIIFFY